MSLIKIYKDNPTAGLTDGTLVSSGDWTEPIHSGAIKVPETGFEEGAWIKLAVRCDSDFETVEEDAKHATLNIINTTHVDKWRLAPDDNDSPDELNAEDWGFSMDITTQIVDTNHIFWIQARAEAGEEPQNDQSVQLQVEAVVGASD